MNDAKHNNNQMNEHPNNAGRTLDDLFASAQSDAGYFESTNAKNSLLKDAMDNESSTVIPAREIQSLGRNPFPKGAIIMSSLTLCAAAILAVSLLGSNSANRLQPSPTAVSNPQSQTSRTAVVHALSKMLENKHRSVVQSPDHPSAVLSSNPIGASRDSGFLNLVNVDGVALIIPSPNQIKQLGLVLSPGGDIVYRFRTDDDKRLMTQVFKPGFGSGLSIGDKGTGGKTQYNLPKLAVRMVTNPNGEKRFFHFEGDNYVLGHAVELLGMNDSSSGRKFHTSVTINNDPFDSGMHKGGYRKVEEVSSVYDRYPVASDSLQRQSNLLQQQLEETNEVSTVSGSSSLATDSLHTQLEEENNVVINSASGQPPLPPSHPTSGKFINKREIVISKTDSNFSDAEVNDLRQKYGIAKNDHRKVLIKMIRTSDSAVSDANSLLKSLGIPDSLLANGIRGIPDSAALAKLLVDVKRQVMNLDHSKMDSMLNDVMDQVAKNQPDINKLIPLLITNKSASGKDNTLIFWYDPSPELDSIIGKTAIPNAVTSEPRAMGAIESLSAYPNPTNGMTTLRYTLADTRTLIVQLYNLLGQKMLDAGTIVDASGSGEMKIDLSQIQAGVYMLVARTDKGEQMSERIVIEK